MIRIKRVRAISSKVIVNFTPHSFAEWMRMRPIRWNFYRRAKGLWVLYSGKLPLCVIGVEPTSWLGTGAEVFFLLCKGGQRKARQLVTFLRRAFRHMLRCFPRLVVSVEADFWIGARFVEFFGFHPFTEVRELAGVKYKTYEMRAPWL